MAEIHIERKKNVWPWVVALIVLLLLVWGAFELMDNDRAANTMRPAVTAPAAPPATTDPTVTDPMITDPAATDTSVTGDAATPASDDTPPPPQP